MAPRAGVARNGMAGRWLMGLNGIIAALLAAAVAAPALMAVGLTGPAQTIYAAFHTVCHQRGPRSFFLFSSRVASRRPALEAARGDANAGLGTRGLGWKMAVCERDLGILAGLLLFGMAYAAGWRRQGLRPSGYLLFGGLSLPLVLDSLTQHRGVRESNRPLRMATGLLCGGATAWLLYPRFEAASARVNETEVTAWA